MSKLKAKGRKILADKKTHVPDFNVMDYDSSLIRALNFYSSEVEDKHKRQYAYTYWKSKELDVKRLDKLPDSWFSTVGAVAHMVLKAVPLNDTEVARLDNAYLQLCAIAVPAEVEKASVAVETTEGVQDRIFAGAKLHIGEMEGWIDDFVTTGTVNSCKNYLAKNQVKAPTIKYIIDHFRKSYLLDLEAYAQGDDEMIEAYSNLGKVKVRKLSQYINSIIEECGTVAQISRTTRAPRKRKEQPASKVVAKMKWMREFADLGLKSVNAEKIVGAESVWLFDTAKRRVIKYESIDGMTLTVKGTTLQNWNPEKSGSKIIRKPDIQLNGISDKGKRPMTALYNEIKGAVGKVKGRTSDDMIILKVF